jgi:F0F1-type ATP synthase assembly protein I
MSVTLYNSRLLLNARPIMKQPDSDKRDQDKEQNEKDWRQLASRWMGIGVEFVVVVCLFAYLGYKLDEKLGDTEPGFLIIGFLIGFSIMLYTMIKRAGGLKW